MEVETSRDDSFYILKFTGIIHDELPDRFILSNIFKHLMKSKGYEYNEKELTYSKGDHKIFIMDAYNKKEDFYKIIIQTYKDIKDEEFESIGKDIIEIVINVVEEKYPDLSESAYSTDKEYEYEKKPVKEKKELESYIFPLSEITYRGYIASKKPIDVELDDKIIHVSEDEFDDFLEMIKVKVIAKEFCRGIPIGYINSILPKVDTILILSRQLVVKKKDKDKIIEKVIGFVLLDNPISSKKPLYLHLICTEKGYTGLGEFLMKQVKLIAKDHPILLHSVADLQTYYKEKHGFKVIKMPVTKKKWKGLTPMLYGSRKKNNTKKNNKINNSTRKNK